MRLVLLRHGRSLAQDAPRRGQWEADLLDCGLSRVGWQQSQRLQTEMCAEGFDLVVCAPLTRCIQTALAAFQDLGVPVVLHPCLAADRGGPPESTPRTVAALMEDEGLRRLPGFETLDFSLLGEGWPDVRPPGGPSVLLPWIQGRKVRRVAVVGLFGSLRRLMPQVADIPNCLPLRCEVREGRILLCGGPQP